MKTCPNCGRSIPDGSKFCTYCGSALPQTVSGTSNRNQNRKKAIKYILSGCAALLAFSLLTWFLLQKPARASEYEELLTMGENYLYAADYEKAEELFLQAKELEPKKQEAYQHLDEVYSVTEQTQKAALLRDEANETLETRDLKKYVSYADLPQEEKIQNNRDSAEKAKQDGRLDSLEPAETPKTSSPENQKNLTKIENKKPEFDTVLNLGKLDTAPVEIGHVGWVIAQDQKYGLVDRTGTYVQKPEGLSWTQVASFTDEEPFACTSDEHLSMDSEVSMPSGKTCSGFGGVRGVPVYSLADDQTIQAYKPLTQETLTMPLSDLKHEIETPRFLIRKDGSQFFSSRNYFEGEPYYIYNPAADELYGPYEPGEIAGFGMYSLLHWNFNSLYSLGGVEQVYSPFYVKENDQYTLISKDGTKRKAGFEKAVVISEKLIGARKDKTYTLFDENLNEVYSRNIECGAMPLDGLTPILDQGEWKLVRFRDEKSPDEKKDGTKDQENSVKADQEKELFEKLAGKYSVGGHNQATDLELRADGTFTFSTQSRTRLNPDRPVLERVEASGRLKPGELKDGRNTLKIEDLKVTSPSGTEEETADGTTRWTELPEGIQAGSIFTVYEPDSPRSSLPNGFENWLPARPWAADENKLLVYALSCEGINPLLRMP